DAIVTDALRRVIVPPAQTEGMLHVASNDLRTQFTPPEMELLKDQDVLAVNCTYLGEALATVVFFRDAKAPFVPNDETLVKSISPIFALGLASVVRDTSPEEEFDDTGGTAYQDEDKKFRKKEAPADWWKQGGEAPY